MVAGQLERGSLLIALIGAALGFFAGAVSIPPIAAGQLAGPAPPSEGPCADDARRTTAVTTTGPLIARTSAMGVCPCSVRDRSTDKDAHPSRHARASSRPDKSE